MFERFSDKARRVVVLAQTEARGLNHSYIGTEHLLLGLIGEAAGPVTEVLGGFGVTLDGVRHRVEEIIGRGIEPPGSQFPFTPRAKKILELSLREAQRNGHPSIEPGHILLAIVSEGGGVAARILTESGAGDTVIRDQVLQRLPAEVTPTKTFIAEPAERRMLAVHARLLQADWREVMALLDAIDHRLTAIERHLGITAGSHLDEPPGSTAQ